MAIPWQNWSGSVTCSPQVIARPRTEAELVDILAQATGSVRIAGGGHSFTRLCETDGTLLSLDDLSGVVDVDRNAGTATVWAGTRLYTLGPVLLAHGVGLENMGDIDRQALAGAMSTGTHGTGQTLGSLATQVVGLRMILADGTIVTCSESAQPDLFSAACVSLGVLGVISQITLRVLPAYRLHERTWPAPFEACMEQLADQIQANRHFEFFWSPGDDVCAMKALNPTDGPCVEIAPAISARGRVGRYLTPERVDWSHRVFPSERTIRFNEMEFAVPAGAGPACFRALRQMMRTSFPDVVWPVEYRTVRADDILLSPAVGRATVTISVHQAAELPHAAFFRSAEAIFREYGGRPHWGKMHSHTSRDLRALYPAFEGFLSIREQVDPQGVFLSGYLRSMFGL